MSFGDIFNLIKANWLLIAGVIIGVVILALALVLWRRRRSHTKTRGDKPNTKRVEALIFDGGNRRKRYMIDTSHIIDYETLAPRVFDGKRVVLLEEISCAELSKEAQEGENGNRDNGK